MMEEIIWKLTSWKQDIEYDIKQDWNDDKINNSLQLLRLEQAINLLQNIGKNTNIPE